MDMDRSKTQFRRLQALEEAIRDRRYPNCLRFAMDWEVSQKTIQRDIEFMKYSLGAPIEYDRGKQGYFYTENNWFLPALDVSEGELLALMLGAQATSLYEGTPIAGKLHGILEKISAALPNVVTILPEDAAKCFSFVGAPSRAIDPEVWCTVVRAIQTHRSILATYRAEARPANKSYIINPCQMANIHGDWYLLACIPPHDELTQFALSRFEKVLLNDKHFQPPDHKVIKTRLHENFGQFIRTENELSYKVRIDFTKAISSRIIARIWHPDQTLKLRKDGSGTLELPFASLEEAMHWVLGWGRHVKVLLPSELQLAVKAEVSAMKH